MKYKIDNLGGVGIIDDLPNWELPDNAFSGGINVKFYDGKAAKYKGWQNVFGTIPSNTAKLTLTSYAPTVSQI